MAQQRKGYLSKIDELYDKCTSVNNNWISINSNSWDASNSIIKDLDGSEYWYCWDMFIPEDFGTGSEFTLMQIHDTPDSEDPIPFPNFLFLTDGVEAVALVPDDAPNKVPQQGRSIGRLPLIKGRWTTCCLHVRWDSTPPARTAFIEVIYDGVSMCKEFARANHFDDILGPYMKVGLYDVYDTPNFGTRHAYFRNIRKYDNTESFLSVLGSLPVSIRSLVE